VVLVGLIGGCGGSKAPAGDSGTTYETVDSTTGDSATPPDTDTGGPTTSLTDTAPPTDSGDTSSTDTADTGLSFSGVDRIEVVVPDEADVLFVVDNSCSMYPYQDQLAANFPAMFAYFLGSGVDYHIGVVSTDMESLSHSGRLQERAGERWIDDATPDGSNVFGSMAVLGTSGHYEEHGREAAYTALELLSSGYNAGFTRDQASLHIVVLSDEPDRSTDDPISLSDFTDWLNAERATRPAVSFSSFADVSDDCGEGAAGYEEITAAVGGLVLDICGSDYDEALDELGLFTIGLSRVFALSTTPVPGTIEVFVESGALLFEFDEGDDWNYDAAANAIVFVDYVPAQGDVVLVYYDEASP